MSDDDRALAALPAAAGLVVAVHEYDQPTCHRILAEASTADLQALAVVLAAMVPVDKGTAALLSQVDPDRRMKVILRPEDWTDEDLARAHAEWNRLRKQGLSVDAWVALGEKEYQARSYRRRKHVTTVNRQARELRGVAS